MPSSPNYVRDYKQEEKTAQARGEVSTGHNSANAERHRARRLAIKLGMIKQGDPRDIDHIKPLVKGGAATDASNLRPRDPHANRSYHRTSTAGMA